MAVSTEMLTAATGIVSTIVGGAIAAVLRIVSTTGRSARIYRARNTALEPALMDCIDVLNKHRIPLPESTRGGRLDYLFDTTDLDDRGGGNGNREAR